MRHPVQVVTDSEPVDSTFETIIYESVNAIVSIRLNRPLRKNALSEQMYDELAVAVSKTQLDPSVRVLIVAGTAGAFCAGVDLAGAVGVPVDEATLTRVRRHGRLARMLHELPIPTIAAVDGPAVGAGCNLALGCDFVISTEHGSFSEIFVNRGMGLDWGGSWLLPRLVGLRRAKELAFLGERVTASEALELGLINRVVPADCLQDAVTELAGRLAGLPPLALTMIKEELHASVAPSFSSAVQWETYGQSASSVTADAREGFSAFLEKRAPVFRGE